jgi:putative membrane protein
MPNPPSERKLHPVSFAFELASHLRQILLPGLFVLIAGARGSDTWEIYAMVLLVPFALVSIARALVFRYSLEPDELSIRSGLLFKQQRHIPYPRIQNIDAIQNIFHRALRVVEVRLETAGGEEPEAHLKVVSLAAFEEVRARVSAARAELASGAARSVAERQGTAPSGATGAIDETQAVAPASVASDAAARFPVLPAADRPTMELLRLPTRELIICGLIQGRGLLVIGALFGLLWETGLVDRITGSMFGDVGDVIEGRGVVRQLLRAMSGQGIPPLDKLPLTLGAFALLLIVTRVFSVGWALVRLHGFTLRRIGDDLRVDFGLFTRVAATVPGRRIQSVTVHEGPLHRLFARVSVHVDTAGGESGESVQLQRQWLAPVVRRDEVVALLREILPAAAAETVTWQPVDPRGIRRARIASAVVAAVFSSLLVFLLRWWTLVLLAGLLIVGEVNARKSVRAIGWSVTATGILFRSGWLWRRQTAAPFPKIQVVSVQESPFDRRLQMASVQVDTAGTSGADHRIDVPYLSRSTAEGLAAELAHHVGRTQFKW